MSKYPANAPTFSKAPYKRRKPMTDQELADFQMHKFATQQALEEACKKTREFNRLLRTDTRKALEFIGKPLPTLQPTIKRRF